MCVHPVGMWLMGAGNVLAAYDLYGDLGGVAFKILIYMCAKSMDTDPEPWFGLGHAHLAEKALGRLPPLTAADAKAVERGVAELRKRGAISLERRGAIRRGGHHTTRYQLHLVKPFEDPPHPTENVG